MNNEIKKSLLAMTKKFIPEWSEKLNSQLADLKVYSKSEDIDACIELADKIKTELEKLKSTLSA